MFQKSAKVQFELYRQTFTADLPLQTSSESLNWVLVMKHAGMSRHTLLETKFMYNN
jgi:hypothetical protein